MDQMAQSDVVFKDLSSSIISTQTTGWPHVSVTKRTDKLLEGMLGECILLFNILRVHVMLVPNELCAHTLFHMLHATLLLKKRVCKYVEYSQGRSLRKLSWAEHRSGMIRICIQRRRVLSRLQMGSLGFIDENLIVYDGGEKRFIVIGEYIHPCHGGVPATCVSSVSGSLTLRKHWSSISRSLSLFRMVWVDQLLFAHRWSKLYAWQCQTIQIRRNILRNVCSCVLQHNIFLLISPSCPHFPIHVYPLVRNDMNSILAEDARSFSHPYRSSGATHSASRRPRPAHNPDDSSSTVPASATCNKRPTVAPSSKPHRTPNPERSNSWRTAETTGSSNPRRHRTGTGWPSISSTRGRFSG